MIKKRYLLVGALVFCLTATIFIVSSTGYDPWIDYDEDGTVDYDDFISLAGEYGTSGDPTKNVSVTNWPEPQKPTFAETLVLRGIGHALLQRIGMPEEWDTLGVLVDENMPNLPQRVIYNYTGLYTSSDVPTGWEKQADRNFTYVPANSRFFIQGEATIIPTISTYFTSTSADFVYYEIVVHLEKVHPEVTTILASDIISLQAYVDGTVSETWDYIGVILDIPVQVVVNPGERLRIRFETHVRCQYGFVDSAMIILWHTLGTDEFIAYIPILQS